MMKFDSQSGSAHGNVGMPSQEILSDEEMRSRAAAYARQVYERQLETLRKQRAQQVEEQQRSAMERERLRQLQSENAQRMFGMPPQPPAPPLPPVQNSATTQSIAPVPAAQPNSSPAFARRRETVVTLPAGNQNMMLKRPSAPGAATPIPKNRSLSGGEPVRPLNVRPKAGAQRVPAVPVSASAPTPPASEESPFSEIAEKKVLPQKEAGISSGEIANFPRGGVGSGETVSPLAGGDEDFSPESEAEAAVSPSAPPKSVPAEKSGASPAFRWRFVISGSIILVLVAMLVAAGYIIFSSDPRFEVQRNNFFRAIGWENAVSVPADSANGADDDEASDEPDDSRFPSA